MGRFFLGRARRTWRYGMDAKGDVGHLLDGKGNRNISVGRSLFVDEFLVDASLSYGVARAFYAAECLLRRMPPGTHSPDRSGLSLHVRSPAQVSRRSQPGHHV